MRAPGLLRRIVVALVVLCIVQLTGCDNAPTEGKKVFVIFRFDDYSARTPTEFALKLVDAFRGRGISLTLGVIPFVCSGDLHDAYCDEVLPLASKNADILRTGVKDGVLDVALHGYSHETIDADVMKEFPGLAPDIQAERLASGKAFIEAIINTPVTTFVPPWNRYDLNTLGILEKLGFSTVSASKDGEATEGSKLKFLPTSSDLGQVRQAVEGARTSPDAQPLIVVLFHEYDFREMDYERGSVTYREFIELLDWLKSQSDIRLLSVAQATESIRDLGVNRFLVNKRNFSLSNLLPEFLQGRETQYREVSVLQKLFLKLGGFYFSITGLATALSFAVGSLISRRFPGSAKLNVYASVALLALALLYVLHDLDVSIAGLMAIAGSLGLAIGSCLSFLYGPKARSLRSRL